MYGTDLAIMARGMLARRDCLIARRIDYERLKNLLRMIETAKEVAGLLRAPEAKEAVSEREMLALTDEARRIAGRNDPERGMPPHGDLEDEVLIIWMADMSVGNGRLKSILEVTIPTAGVVESSPEVVCCRRDRRLRLRVLLGGPRAQRVHARDALSRHGGQQATCWASPLAMSRAMVCTLQLTVP